MNLILRLGTISTLLLYGAAVNASGNTANTHRVGTVMGLTSIAVEALPQPGFPLVLFTNPSGASYTASTGAFNITSSPWLAVMDSSGINNLFITGTGNADQNVTINVVLNPADGSLVGGVPGDDFVLKGYIDATYNNSNPDGALLKGEVLSFTYLDDPSATDSAELRFRVTGGSLAANPGFWMQDIGVLVTMENVKDAGNSSFPTVSFSQNFTATAAKGNLGPIPPVANPPCAVSIGDYVWHDLNHDGLQQANEPGINDVTILLKDSSGTVVQSTTTAPGGPTTQGGYYQFAAQCGAYTVQVDTATLPVGLMPTTSTVGSDTTIDSNGSPASVSLTIDGTTDQTIDFGYQSACTSAIGDFVWQDTNLNGVQDSGEPGIDGVTVWLKDSYGNLLETTVTGTGGPNNQPGYYQFNGRCAGAYTVEIKASTLPAGFTATNSNVGGDSGLDSNGSPASVTLATDSGADQTVDFGYKPPCTGSIGDYVWSDANKNGIQDAGEVGINGVRVLLLAGDQQTVLATATTHTGGPANLDGYYQFPGLCANTYYVKVDESTVPPNWMETLVNQGSNDAIDSDGPIALVALPLNSSGDQTIDFGYYPPCTGKIGDFIWHDLSRDGIQDSGEPGINGVTVNLKDSSGTIVATTTTNPGGTGSQDGYYQFTGLCADNYTVEVDTSTLPAGYTPAPINAGADDTKDSDSSPVLVNLPTDSSGNQTIDFGYLSPCTGAIGDYVWEDDNQNGIQDANESGIDGVSVILKDANGNVIASTVTTTGGPQGKPGYYQFNGLCMGSYTVVVDADTLPPGFAATPSGVGTDSTLDSNGSPALVILGSDTTVDASVDFGFKPPCAGKIGDYVWSDLNWDGLQDTNETGINGVTVNLKNSAGTIVYTEATYTNPATGKQGYYQFAGLCTGNYTVEVDATTLPAGYNATTSLVGADHTIDSNGSPTPVSLATNASVDSSIDFGYVAPASLGDYVWYDANGNGLRDAGESPISGIKIELYQCGGSTVLATAYTDNSGLYGFTALPPGSYYVRFYSSTAYPTFTTAKVGTDNAIDSDANSSGYTACVTLTPGQAYTDLDAGLIAASTGGGQPLTIGYWKTHASCQSNSGNQGSVLDQTMALAEPDGIAVGILTLHGSTATPNQAPDCLKAVRLLDKSTINTAAKKASDPAFGLAAQYLAAKVNVLHAAKTCTAQTNALNQAQTLLATIGFNGISHNNMTTAQANTANSLATSLDNYNNARLCP